MMFQLKILALILLASPISAVSDAPAVSFEPRSAVQVGTTMSPELPAASVTAVTKTVEPSPRGGGTPPRTTLITVGLLLAANSGFMNGLALSGSVLGAKQAVAAVTGAWTTSAFSPSARKTQCTMIASYLGGSLINGAINPNGVNWRAPQASLLVAAGLVAGAYSQMKTAGDHNLLIWSLLALINGLQNSWTSSLIQGNILRTAHFSGITSDMGTFLGQILRGNNANAWKLRIFASLAASFFAGGMLSVPAAKRFQSQAFLGTAGLYLVLFGWLSQGKTKLI